MNPVVRWPVPDLLARLSQEIRLHAGDVIFTGTPAGVGPLQPGERVRTEIPGLELLEFGIAAAGPGGSAA